MKSGDDCPQAGCPGVMGVYCSRRHGDYQTRHLRCDHCGHRDKETVSAASVRRRRKRDKVLS